MIYLSDTFIVGHQLKYRGEIDNSHYPPIKVNFSAI